jgi:hypothetical protein
VAHIASILKVEEQAMQDTIMGLVWVLAFLPASCWILAWLIHQP